jgi:hypothetical protein
MAPRRRRPVVLNREHGAGAEAAGRVVCRQRLLRRRYQGEFAAAD